MTHDSADASLIVKQPKWWVFSGKKKSREKWSRKLLQKHTRNWKSMIILYHENIQKIHSYVQNGLEREKNGQKQTEREKTKQERMVYKDAGKK
jgi:hypothetical protein